MLGRYRFPVREQSEGCLCLGAFWFGGGGRPQVLNLVSVYRTKSRYPSKPPRFVCDTDVNKRVVVGHRKVAARALQGSGPHRAGSVVVGGSGGPAARRSGPTAPTGRCGGDR